MHFYIFDCLAWAGENWVKKFARDRFSFISGKINREYVSTATYYDGQELWSMLQEILARGDEGIVITHKCAEYEPGKRPSKTTLKIKKELKQTIDCFFTGVGSAPTKEYTGKEIETWTFWENQITGEKINAEIERASRTLIRPSEELNEMLEELGTSKLSAPLQMSELLKRPQLDYKVLHPQLVHLKLKWK